MMLEFQEKGIAGKTMENVAGRAYTYAEKRAIMEKILAAWAVNQHLRLGQFLENAVKLHNGADLFYLEDEILAEAVLEYAKKVYP